MWEQILAALGGGGGAALGAEQLSSITSDLAMKSSPDGVLQLIGGNPTPPPMAPFAANPPVMPGVGGAPMATPPMQVPGANVGQGFMLTNPPNPTNNSPLINPNAGSLYASLYPQSPPAVVEAAQNVQIAPPKAAGLTPDQLIRLMQMSGGGQQQEQAPRAPAAPSGIPARPPGTAQFATPAVQQAQRASLADLIYRRR